MISMLWCPLFQDAWSACRPCGLKMRAAHVAVHGECQSQAWQLQDVGCLCRHCTSSQPPASEWHTSIALGASQGEEESGQQHCAGGKGGSACRGSRAAVRAPGEGEEVSQARHQRCRCQRSASSAAAEAPSAAAGKAAAQWRQPESAYDVSCPQASSLPSKCWLTEVSGHGH